MFVAPVAIIRRKRIIRQMLEAGAVTPQTAKTLDEAGVFKGSGLIISRLEAHGSLVNAGNGKYYVNVNMY